MSTNKPFREREAAVFLGKAVQTLRNWRNQRKGPNYCKFGRSIIYYEEDLEEYRRQNRVVLNPTKNDSQQQAV
jgi:hypothetical protein